MVGAVTFTDELWAHVADLRARIDRLPFLVAFEDGTLSRDRFEHYLAQDALYLVEYARVMAHAATRSPTSTELVFWTERAANAVQVERELHERHLRDLDDVVMSPTCVAYTSYLLAGCATWSYPILIAAVLPCFWIYDDVGVRLKQRLNDLTEHPYGDWIATYGDAAFTQATDQVRKLVNDAAERAGRQDLEQMRAAFTTAATYEYLFWDAAWRKESWAA